MARDATERPHLLPQQKRKQEENMLTCSFFSRFPFYSFGASLSLWGSATHTRGRCSLLSQSCVELSSQIHLKMCLPAPRVFLNLVKLTVRANHHLVSNKFLGHNRWGYFLAWVSNKGKTLEVFSVDEP